MMKAIPLYIASILYQGSVGELNISQVICSFDIRHVSLTHLGCGQLYGTSIYRKLRAPAYNWQGSSGRVEAQASVMEVRHGQVENASSGIPRDSAKF